MEQHSAKERPFHLLSLFNLSVWEFGIPCWKWPQRTRPWPAAVWLTGKADLICEGGSPKTDHYHTTWDRRDETLSNNTTDGSSQHLKGSSLSIFDFYFLGFLESFCFSVAHFFSLFIYSRKTSLKVTNLKALTCWYEANLHTSHVYSPLHIFLLQKTRKLHIITT